MKIKAVSLCCPDWPQTRSLEVGKVGYTWASPSYRDFKANLQTAMFTMLAFYIIIFSCILYHYFFLPFIFLLFVYSVNKPIQHLHRLRNADFPAAPKTQETEVLEKPLGGICPSNCEKSGSAIGDRAFLGWEMGLLHRRQDPSSDPST